MKFQALTRCQGCGERLTAEMKGSEPYPDLRCECGAVMYAVEPCGTPISRRLFCRAQAELLGEDFSLAIILSAISVECELAFLYSKWRMLGVGLIPSEVTPADTAAWEEGFRKLPGGLSNKLDEVTRLLTGVSFDLFIANRNDLTNVVRLVHPDIGMKSPRAFFVQELFWKRNRIMHSGYVQYGKPDAEACVRIAMSLLQIIREADKERYTRLDDELRGRLRIGASEMRPTAL
jgi:hypothetical protein